MLEEWTRYTPLGVGIDLVKITPLREMDQRMGGVFVRRTFTPREQAEAGSAPDPWCYYAGRFAAKEAVFKATAHLLPEKSYDFRCVEILNGDGGKPYVVLPPGLKARLMPCGIDAVRIVLSVSGDYVIAMAQADGNAS